MQNMCIWIILSQFLHECIEGEEADITIYLITKREIILLVLFEKTPHKGLLC